MYIGIIRTPNKMFEDVLVGLYSIYFTYQFTQRPFCQVCFGNAILFLEKNSNERIYRKEILNQEKFLCVCVNLCLLLKLSCCGNKNFDEIVSTCNWVIYADSLEFSFEGNLKKALKRQKFQFLFLRYTFWRRIERGLSTSLRFISVFRNGNVVHHDYNQPLLLLL